MAADPEFFPYYVLLVGSADTLPYKFQTELDVNYAVGRIYFDNWRNYAAYAESVMRAEERSLVRSREVVFFATEHPYDPSTQRLTEDLVRPLARLVLEPGMPWQIREILGEEARKERLRNLLGGSETPAFLFAACHGVGFDPEDERQEASQGALVCQDWPGPHDEERVHEDQWFAACDVPEDASLHGLVTFLHASYSVGTPRRENFDQISISNARQIARRALVSKLPQRLLSHPAGGALAVIGHVDRSLASSYSDSPKGEGLNAFMYGIRRLLQGHTVGWAMEYLNQSYASLAAMLGDLQKHYREEVDNELFAHLWLVRNEARNLMVFGDPAVRLPGVGEPR